MMIDNIYLHHMHADVNTSSKSVESYDAKVCEEDGYESDDSLVPLNVGKDGKEINQVSADGHKAPGK